MLFNLFECAGSEGTLKRRKVMETAGQILSEFMRREDTHCFSRSYGKHQICD